MEKLDFIINGGETRRFHTWPVLRPQTVAEHSFHVAMLYSLMAGDHTPTTAEPVSLGVPGLMAALCHDLAEWQMGDIPSPAKRAMPMIGAVTFRQHWGEMEQEKLTAQDLWWEDLLTPIEARWLKLADAMQGALYCIRERMMGNKLIVTPFNNFRRYIGELMPDDGPLSQHLRSMEQQIIDYIDDMWEQANA